MSRSNITVVVSINEILELLKRGVTRLNRDKFYHPERGSIQSIYGLTATEVTELFLDPRLAKKKTIVPKSSRIVIAEDQEQSDQEEHEESNDEMTNSTMEADVQELPQTPYGAVGEADASELRTGGYDAGEIHASTTRTFVPERITEGRTAYIGGIDSISL